MQSVPKTPVEAAADRFLAAAPSATAQSLYRAAASFLVEADAAQHTCSALKPNTFKYLGHAIQTLVTAPTTDASGSLKCVAGIVALSALITAAHFKILAYSAEGADATTECRTAGPGEQAKEIGNLCGRLLQHAILRVAEALGRDRATSTAVAAGIDGMTVSLLAAAQRGLVAIPIVFKRNIPDLLVLCTCLLRIGGPVPSTSTAASPAALHPLAQAAARTAALCIRAALHGVRGGGSSSSGAAAGGGAGAASSGASGAISGSSGSGGSGSGASSALDLSPISRTICEHMAAHTSLVQRLAAFAPVDAPLDAPLAAALLAALPAEGVGFTKPSPALLAALDTVAAVHGSANTSHSATSAAMTDATDGPKSGAEERAATDDAAAAKPADGAGAGALDAALSMCQLIGGRICGLAAILRFVLDPQPAVPLLAASTLRPFESTALPLSLILSACEHLCDAPSTIVAGAYAIQPAAAAAALADKQWRAALSDTAAGMSAAGLQLLAQVCTIAPDPMQRFRTHVSRVLIASMRNCQLAAEKVSSASSSGGGASLTHALLGSMTLQLLPCVMNTSQCWLRTGSLGVPTKRTCPEALAAVQSLVGVCCDVVDRATGTAGRSSSIAAAAAAVSLDSTLSTASIMLQQGWGSISHENRFRLEQSLLVLIQEWPQPHAPELVSASASSGSEGSTAPAPPSKRARVGTSAPMDANSTPFSSTGTTADLLGPVTQSVRAQLLPKSAAAGFGSALAAPHAVVLTPESRSAAYEAIALCATLPWSNGALSPLLQLLVTALHHAGLGHLAPSAAIAATTAPRISVAAMAVAVPTTAHDGAGAGYATTTAEFAASAASPSAVAPSAAWFTSAPVPATTAASEVHAAIGVTATPAASSAVLSTSSADYDADMSSAAASSGGSSVSAAVTAPAAAAAALPTASRLPSGFGVASSSDAWAPPPAAATASATGGTSGGSAAALSAAAASVAALASKYSHVDDLPDF